VFRQVAQHIFLGDAALQAGTGDLTEVELIFLGDAPHQRRGANSLAGHLRPLQWGQLRLRRGRCGELLRSRRTGCRSESR